MSGLVRGFSVWSFLFLSVSGASYIPSPACWQRRHIVKTPAEQPTNSYKRRGGRIHQWVSGNKLNKGFFQKTGVSWVSHIHSKCIHYAGSVITVANSCFIMCAPVSYGVSACLAARRWSQQSGLIAERIYSLARDSAFFWKSFSPCEAAVTWMTCHRRYQKKLCRASTSRAALL